MNIYEQVPMLTLGNVPTVTVEVPVSVPTPFIPDGTKNLLWVLGGLAFVGFILWLFSEWRSRKKSAEIEDWKAKHAEQMRQIAVAKTPPVQLVKLF